MQKIFLTLSVFFIFNISYSQNITGTWQGDLNVQGNSIPIVFHIVKDSSNNLAASFDSPSQHAFNLPCTAVIVKEDSVILMMESINGKYAGKLSAEKKQMTGTWHQGGGSLALDVNKTSETAEIKKQNRPQTPKPPYPYQSEDVEYFNADKTLQYGATITYPTTAENNKKQKFPSVILITGSGQQDRDETIFGHKSFAVIADYLTKKGYLVLRVDDRSIGKSTGNFAKSTTADFVKDVEASLDFLEQQPQVDKNKIGLLGHSEGGMIAPVVADARKEINFIVLLAGPGIPIQNLMGEQLEAVGSSQGLSPLASKFNAQIFDMIADFTQKDGDSTFKKKMINSLVDCFQKNPKAAEELIMTTPDLIENHVESLIATFKNPWYKYFLAFNPQPYLEKLHCKVLSLNGSKDVQVIAKSNLTGIKASLKKSSSPKYDVIEIPGLNHLFQTCIKCSPDEYGDLEETFSPKALEIIGTWLDKNIK
ncbi:MAG: alpha/beta hydrolase [Ferruginibacter sp.]